MKKTGHVLKTLRPGDAGTENLVRRFGEKLIVVRYRGNPSRRVRSTTVEIVVDEGFWMPHCRSVAAMLAKACLDMDMLVKS